MTDPIQSDSDFERAKAALAGAAAADAVPLFLAVLERDPDHVEASGLLGDAYIALERWDEAMASYRAALALDPHRGMYRYNLATILANLGRHEEAAPEFRLALEAMPDHAETHNNLAVSLQALGRYPESILHYHKAITLKPSLSDSYSNVGNALLELGRVEEARTAFAAAIAHAPERCLYYFNFANVHRFAPGDPYLAAMERLARDAAGRDMQEQITLHFALAQAYGDIGRTEPAFDHLRKANALKRSQVAYDEAASLGEMERIARVFDPALMRDKAGLGDPSMMPVFIVGMPRSGTTLVEQLLASHFAVYGAGELYALDTMAKELAGPDGEFPECVPALSGPALRDLGARYLHGLVIEKPLAVRVTDKMPWNFRFLGLIKLILPRARIIHVSRDPVDTCLSCFARLFTFNQPFSYDLGELGRYYRGYRTLMDHWRRLLPTGMILEVRYEELVADFEAGARQIVAFCGLPWSEACLDFHRTPRLVRTASAAQVRQPVYRTSVDRWRDYRALVTPLIEALGPEDL
jgi:tetratricopeptide (TPR) repeat protein